MNVVLFSALGFSPYRTVELVESNLETSVFTDRMSTIKEGLHIYGPIFHTKRW